MEDSIAMLMLQPYIHLYVKWVGLLTLESGLRMHGIQPKWWRIVLFDKHFMPFHALTKHLINWCISAYATWPMQVHQIMHAIP